MNTFRLNAIKPFPPEVEAAFRSDYTRRNRILQRFGLSGLLLIIVIFGSLDINAPVESYRIGLYGLYGFICPLLITLIRFTYLPAYAHWSQHSMVVAIWSIAGELWLMEYLVPTDKGSDASPTTVGLIVFVMVASTLLRLRTGYLAVCCVGCWLAHTVLSFTVFQLPYPRWNASVLLTTCIIGILAARIMENHARKEFRLRWILMAKRNKLALRNQDLHRLATQRANDMEHIHHDVGNRVVSATALLETALDRVSKVGYDETQERTLLALHEELDAINRLFTAMLYRARLEAGVVTEPSWRETVELPHWTRRLIDSRREVLEKLHDRDAGPAFELRFAYINPDRTPSRCPIDTIALEMILINLLDNAVKYSPQGGNITVTLWQHEDAFCLRVSDEGVGILPADQERIFALRHRGSQAGGPISGKGIGLHHVRQLIEEQGGSIFVESAGIPGQGSAFTLTLPISKQLTSGAEAQKCFMTG